MYSLPVSFFICIVCGNLFTLLYCMWVHHCLSNLLLIDTWIVSSVGVMSNAAINSLVHIFGVYTLFSMGYIPAFLPLKKFRGEIEMLTSQKCGTTWPFDSFKKKVKLKSSLWPNNSTPGYLSKRNENINPQKPATRMFLTVLFIITPNWKQSKCLSTEEWINKPGLFTQWTPRSRGESSEAWTWTNLQNGQSDRSTCHLTGDRLGETDEVLS